LNQKNNKLPTAAKVTNDGTMADECVSIKKGDELVRRKDVEKLIEDRQKELREEIEELKENYVLSESNWDRSEVNIFRKRLVEQIKTLEILLEEIQE